MSTLGDLRHGARLLRLNPGFFTVATLSLALGIGANTAIFQLLDAVRLRLLPVAHPEQLAELEIAKNEHCCSGTSQTGGRTSLIRNGSRSAIISRLFRASSLGATHASI